MFPVDVNFDNIKISTRDANGESEKETDSLGRSFYFDFEKKCYVFEDGKNKECNKIEAIKQYTRLYINTAIHKFKVYDDKFGVNVNDLVGWRLPRSYVVSEIKRRITEGLLDTCPCVVGIKDWTFDRGMFTFTMVLDTGEEVSFKDV